MIMTLLKAIWWKLFPPKNVPEFEGTDLTEGFVASVPVEACENGPMVTSLETPFYANEAQFQQYVEDMIINLVACGDLDIEVGDFYEARSFRRLMPTGEDEEPLEYTFDEDLVNRAYAARALYENPTWGEGQWASNC